MYENGADTRSDLVPTLRQGIDIIKMVLFKELKPHMEKRYPQLTAQDAARLAAAVINDLFGIKDMETSVEAFTAANRQRIDAEAAAFGDNFDHLRIPLTDALRVQYLCDSHEGINGKAVLEKADKRNILISERDVPLPGAFMNIVRAFGAAYKILEPLKPPPPKQGNS